MNQWIVVLTGFYLTLSRNIVESNNFPTRYRRSNIPCGTSFTPCSRSPSVSGTLIHTIDIIDESGKPSFLTFNTQTSKQYIPEYGMIVKAASIAKQDIDKLFNETESAIFSDKKYAQSAPQAEKTWSNLLKVDNHAKQLSYSALISIGTSQRLQNSQFNADRIPFDFESLEVHNTPLGDVCPLSSIQGCEPGEYRSHSGHCNNVNNPLWGAVYEPMQRLLKPDYSDVISNPRVSMTGAPLPSARDLSNELFSRERTNEICTALVAQWALFIYEDMTRLGTNQVYRGDRSRPLACCNEDRQHPECYPIKISENDNAYAKFSRCHPYTRTIVAPRENCALGHREQANQATSYLDGSQIYGSTIDQAKLLRIYKNGYLASQKLNGQDELLPDADSSECSSSSTSQRCFRSGGQYTNLIPTNTAMHTIWMRQHNRIVNQLKAINNHWNDEQLFQEARRIVVAQLQHITYNEFLPIVIGRDNLRKYELNLRSHAYDSNYNLKVNPTVLNEFASAAGLFFFSLFPDHFGLYNTNRRLEIRRLWSELYNNPSLIYDRDGVESTFRYLLSEGIPKSNIHMSAEFRSRFLLDSDKFSLDLAAMIIQMGRDHGLPSYNKFRRYCGLTQLSNFSYLSDVVQESVNISAIASIYTSIDDADLFVLGLAEKPMRGALVGPTFGCIIGEQFQRTRRGDRFWYENFFNPSSFTMEQLNELRKTTLASIICHNSNKFGKIQLNVFEFADKYGNCPIECNSTILGSMNMNEWADHEPYLKLPITKETLQKAIRLGKEHAERLDAAENLRIRARGSQKSTSRDSASITHANLMAPKNQSLKLSRTAAILREATKILLQGNELDELERLPSKLDIPTLQRLLPEVDVSRFIGNISDYLGHDAINEGECLSQPLPCDHTTKYRTFSGWCNNLRFPHYGNAFSPMRRLLDPVYDDGFDTPRTIGRNSRKLPSARAVSNAIHSEAQLFDTKFSHMLMQMGQIIDHDFAHSPTGRGPGNVILECDRCDSQQTLSIHCFPIEVGRNDPYFPHLTETGEPRCLSFVRSLAGQFTLGYRNQLNQLTSFLDASFIYGSTECEANSLRLFSQGRLNFTDLGFNKEALPQGSQERDCRSNPRHPCFNAGDERSNEQPGLTVLHTLFLRDHNRIATPLNRINNFWTDEKIYLETRRIMGAKVQHIIYNEWLPIILGCQIMTKYDLVPQRTGYYAGYDEQCDVTILQELATSAFRFGHSLIRNMFPRMSEDYDKKVDPLPLKRSFNNQTFYYSQKEGHIESVLMGLLGAESMAFDRHIVDAIRNHLFEKKSGPYTGLDLPALNIQRGRDHGVPSYNAYREYCGVGSAKTFDDLHGTMEKSAVKSFKSIYNHVDDIDLFPGLMSELPVEGALLGQTGACIIAEQFKRLKKCDRFYYENGDHATRFTPAQLAEIRKSTMSKLLCSNSQYARKIQPNAFLLQDDLTNAPVKCSELPDMDLYEWIDRQFCIVDHRIISLGKTKRITPCVTCTCTSEGAECHSMTVESCEDLLNDYLFSEITSDTVCILQCSNLIRRHIGRIR